MRDQITLACNDCKRRNYITTKNKRLHPDVLDLVMKQGYGTQCHKLPDGSLANDCKVH